MFLFLKLYLAHLIADFILQFDELYRLKVKSRLGHLLHVLIHFATSLALVFPYRGERSVWVFLVFITVCHYLQDNIKYAVQKTRQKMFAAFVLDQLVHFLVIGSVLWLPVSRRIIGFPNHPALNFYYTDSFFTLILIFFILSTFGGSYLLHAFRKSYFANCRPDYAITSREMAEALIERSLIAFTFLFCVNPLWLAATVLTGILRLLSKNTRSLPDFGLSFTYAALMGLVFKFLIR